MSGSTIIIGGGLAGLAAAVSLAQRGVSVTVLESRPRLGGRASSFVDRETGTEIDNCQHVSMGCCTNFRHFCDTVGISDLFRTEKELNFYGPNRPQCQARPKRNRLTSSILPTPCHLAPAFTRIVYLSLGDKLCIARGLNRLAKSNSVNHGDQTFADWLREQGQTPNAIGRFWHVVLVSALSETLDRISFAHARKVFVDAFLAHRQGWQVAIPTVPLNQLYGTRLADWLGNHGVTVRLQTGVQRVMVDGERVSGVELRNGERLAANHFVLAVPHFLVASLLPAELQNHRQVAGIARMESAPISSVHLWFDRPITPLPHAVFVERLTQWMFNRSVLQADISDRFYYQVVISASRDLPSQDEAIAHVIRDLTDVWPETADARLVHARLVTEHRAVFSVQPGVDELRPPQQSPVTNLQFAGDWTRTGWPATMEGAVRSGYLAAENILRQLGRPEMLLQPDLTVSLLSKLLLRI